MIRKQTKVWTTKDGRDVRLCDMTDSHIVNLAWFLRRTAQERLREEVRFMMNVPEPTGDIASMTFNQEFDTLMEASWEDYVHPIFDKVLLEMCRRGFNKQASDVVM